MNILVVNDDGPNAFGLQVLREALVAAAAFVKAVAGRSAPAGRVPTALGA